MPEGKSQKLVIIGAGVNGQGLALLARSLGAEVFVSEQKNINDEAKTLFSQNNITYEENGHTGKVFEGTDCILISSGIPPQSEILHEAAKRSIKIDRKSVV